VFFVLFLYSLVNVYLPLFVVSVLV
jgi:hypothetical protein